MGGRLGGWERGHDSSQQAAPLKTEPSKSMNATDDLGGHPECVTVWLRKARLMLTRRLPRVRRMRRPPPATTTATSHYNRDPSRTQPHSSLAERDERYNARCRSRLPRAEAAEGELASATPRPPRAAIGPSPRSATLLGVTWRSAVWYLFWTVIAQAGATKSKTKV